ncbi:DUF4173 domain-containing protein [Paenibacillus piri]|uniref:DUF4173 domain-containing protein n=1 Tax=Paenibacillus piri TaxID=2547395 RepID=A0A4R5KEN0_9BACL|nr:DUF4173 domain-containing protein [Paenibacillus piri]TDF93859.1 DUF4173 domain-containing protein [Paenibacillus piri]
MTVHNIAATRRDSLLLLGALLCGGLHHLLFYGQAWGISYPIFMLAFYMYFYWAVKERSELRFDASLLMLLPIALLSLTYTAYTNLLFAFLNALLIPCMAVVHTTWLIRRPAVRWYEKGMAAAALEQLFIHTLRHVPLPVKVTLTALTGKLSADRSSQLWKVLAGVFVSLPLLLLVGTLLASADTVFNRLLAKLPWLLQQLELMTLLLRIGWIAVVATAIFAYVYGLLRPAEPMRGGEREAPREAPMLQLGVHTQLYADADSRSADGTARSVHPVSLVRLQPAGPAQPYAHADSQPDDPAQRHAHADSQPADPASLHAHMYPRTESKPIRLDATMMATILVIMNAVYVLFAVVQFSYFFAGGSASLPEGITYAEYARRGFAELVVVTVINFTLLMVTLHSVDRSAPAMNRLLKSLLAMLVGCTGVMLCSAYFRLSMYEQAYGFTVTRVLVHAFMIFLLLLFAIALFKVWNDRFRLMKPYLIAAVASYVLLNYMQVDGMIASLNIQRYEATGRIDTGYLGSLGYEAVPYLIKLHSSHPEVGGTREALLSIKDSLSSERNASWTSFNVSKWRAAQALRQLDG